MKAIIIEQFNSIEKNPLKLVSLPIPEPNDNEILVKIKACAICHTDLHIAEGEVKPPCLPVIPGHQVIGIIEKIGKAVTTFKEKDRVGLAWLNWTCGACEFCTDGKENLCDSIKFTGFHSPGGYCEYTVVNEKFAYKIPDNFTDEEAAPLLCAGIIGYRSFRLSDVKLGHRLGLFGFGASAHIVIQIAKYLGIETYVFSRSEQHRNLALSLGATWVGEANQNPPKKINSAIIFAPAGNLVLDALRVLEKGGTIALGGIYMSQIPPIDYLKDLYYEKTIRSVTASTRKDGEELLLIASQIPIKTKTQIFTLEEANQALKLLKDGKINGAGVIKIN